MKHVNQEEEYWKEKAKVFGMEVGQLKQAAYSSLLVWAETHRVIMGKPFSLADYPFMEDIYMDFCREMCIIKSAQCFLEGTSVRTDNGDVKINKIKEGDMVLTHKGRFRKVLNVMSRESDKLRIVTADGQRRVICTEDHKFLTKEHGWHKAKDLLVKKDTLYIADSENNIVERPFKKREGFYGKRMVYDLTVEEDHSYTANGYVVHNCSASEYLTNIMLFIADTNRGHTYLAFPTSKDVGIFVQGRIDSAASESPYISSRLKGKTDNTSIKKFGLRLMYFTGAQNRRQIISSPADIVCQDEYDEHNYDTDTTLQKRMNNSNLKMLRKISTPTIPGVGISSEYEKSSKAVWITNCKSCKKEIQVSGLDIGDRWQSMIKQVAENEYVYCCPYCKEETTPSTGRWRHTTDSEYHGYSINRMMTKNCTANELMKAYEEADQHDNMKEFFNSDLGIPYETKGSRVYEGNCRACEQDYKTINIGINDVMYFGGMDIGKKKHIVMLHEEQRSIIVDFADTINTFEDGERIMKDFNTGMFVCDYRPEPTKVFELYQKHRIVRGAEHNTGIVKPTSNHGKEEHVIGYNRFFSIERMYNYILAGRMVFPRNIQSSTNGDFYRHLCSQVKVERVTDSGSRVSEYVPSNGKKKTADHFLFALIYAVAALDSYKEMQEGRVDSGFMLL